MHLSNRIYCADLNNSGQEIQIWLFLTGEPEKSWQCTADPGGVISLRVVVFSPHGKTKEARF